MRGRNKHIIWLFFKIFMVLFLCLAGSLCFHRKRIVEYVINHELDALGVYDLEYAIGEFNLCCFELRDISWGRSKDPFLYISSLKVFYTPKRLYAGVVDKVGLGRFETTISFDEKNKPRFELLERVQLVSERAKLKYAAKTESGRNGTIVLPGFELKRGVVSICGSDGVGNGQIDFEADIPGDDGCVALGGYISFPDGKSTAFTAQVDLSFVDILSSLSAKIISKVDLGGLMDERFTFEPQVLDLTGDLYVNNLQNAPEWALKVKIPSQVFNSENDVFSLSADLQGESEFQGSITNLGGLCDFELLNLRYDVKACDDRPAVTNGADVTISFELPATGVESLPSARINGSLDCVGIYSQSDDLIDLSDGTAAVSFSVSNDEGFQASELCTFFPHLSVMDMDIQEKGIDLSLSNGIVRIQAMLAVVDEPIEFSFDAHVPFSDPQAGELIMDVPPVKIDSEGKIGDIVQQKIGKSSVFSGVFSARIFIDGFKPDAVVTGFVDVADGSLHQEKLLVDGINFNMPFVFDGKLLSSDTPVLVVDSVEAGNLRLSDGKVFFHVKEDELFVESASIGWAKGFLRAYAVHAGLDGNILNEFIVYADRVDMGEVFMLVTPMEGEMEGVLYGRFAIGLKNKRVDLSTGYLYSLPGQGGYLKIDDPASMESLLRRAGVRRDVDDIARALSDLELSTIRLDLDPGEGDDSSLRIKLAGKSNYEKRPAPVNLNLNLNGPLDEVLNLGMDLQRLWGKRQ